MPAAVIATSRRATSSSPPEPAVEAAAASGLGVGAAVDSETGWRGVAGAGPAPGRGILGAGRARRSAGANRGSWAMSTSAGASTPAVLSTLALKAVESAAPLAGDGAPPVGTDPVAEGTTSMYWAIAASDGTVGGGAAAITGDAIATATPAEQLAAMSPRIDD